MLKIETLHYQNRHFSRRKIFVGLLKKFVGYNLSRRRFVGYSVVGKGSSVMTLADETKNFVGYSMTIADEIISSAIVQPLADDIISSAIVIL